MYAAYFVFKPTGEGHGFEHIRIDATVRLAIYLDTNQSVISPDAGQFNPEDSFLPEEEDGEEEEDQGHIVPRERADGWLETKLGYFVYQGHEDSELE
ncbi:hypothetical protein Ddye_010333 [Dipteronia dyeriana]|uniref:Uncharacterized protein n=1 Tax=Dipteronia dyeriana TaxID=168575 RepID=A0AAE0CN66_9ROSI|nr:hypothetical protein Ddye_010333 [Dipteronia dyeriana]